jgi:putative ABC transport system permease protein
MRERTFTTMLSIALRNLSRHRVKTIITATAVAVSVCLYIAADGWLHGMNLESRRNIVSYEIGAAKIQTKAYFEKKDDLPMYEAFSGWEGLSESLSRAGYDSAPRFVFSGTLYSRTGTAPILFNGVDPEREARLLRYTAYMESGRYPLPGAAEIALGTMAAEKLRVGIPARPKIEEYRTELLGAAADGEEEAFIASLYEERPEDGVMALRDVAPRADLDRLWDILSRSGRMDVRISTVIDITAAPESIRADRFEEDLLPSLDEAGRTLVSSAYEQDPLLGDYFLTEEDPDALTALLRVMTDAEYSGAIRHVNQLIDATVVGVVNSPNPKTNANIAFIPLDALQGDTGLMLNGAVTELLVRAAGASDAALPGKTESKEAILSALGTALPEHMTVEGWQSYAEDYIAASNGDNVSTRIMILFLFVLSFIGIANTILMAVLERTKEMGMMRALGMTDSQLIISYIVEAGLIGFIGSLAGVALGCLINIPMVNSGIDFSAMAREMGGDFGYRVASRFRSAWNLPVIIGTGVVATALSGCTALPPVLRALRMPVTESLRFE